MRYCYLVGHIPESFGMLSNLVGLDLAGNSLKGKIPSGIWMLEKLENLQLSENMLSGDINNTIGAKSLVEIDVSGNNINGSVPEGFTKLHNLTRVVMTGNQLSGVLPAEFGLSPSLCVLQLSSNKLTGFLSLHWANRSKLNTLDLSNNNFSGKIPAAISSLWQLSALDLSHNQISGEIPTAITSLQQLTQLDLSYNQIYGEIPTAITSLPQLTQLDLSNNQISGGIPTAITSLRQLTQLNLSNNQISGGIPTAITSLQQLTQLDLSYNQIYGEIPPEMGMLKLQYLDLTANKLSGQVPVIFENPTYRYSFYSNHHLCSRSNFFYKVPKCDQSKISSNILKLLLVIGAVFLLALFTAGLFLRRKLRRPRKSSENLSRTWTITTFHSMQLSDLSIIPQLTDDNLIGRGGAGMVYQMILSEESGHKVAVKKIWNSRKLDEKLEKEFLAEVQILGLIRHKHIVKLFGCLSSSDSKLLVYEYMENGSLDRFLHHQVQGSDSEGYIALDWPTRLRIAIGAAKGLCYMHHDCSPPIVHRDVKSGNILLDSEFNAKIADFGLARILVKAGQPESVSVMAGTFGYMAPECGWSRNVNEKMDVYSFGVVLLELTTGRKANYGEDYGNLADAVWRHLQETGGVVNLIANEIREARYIEKIESVIKLGIICTGMLPSSRPSMKEVLQVLLWNPRSDQIEDNGENETIQ